MSKLALRLLCTLLPAALLVVGCTPALLESPPRGLPSPASLPNTLVLEVSFVERPLNDPLLGPELWQSVDENVIEPYQRRALNRNGIRLGIVGGQMPAALETLLRADESSPVPPDTDAQQSPETSAPLAAPGFQPLRSLADGPSALQLILHEGIPGKIVAGEPLPECLVLLDDDGIKARRLSDARFLYHVTPVSLDGSSVRLELRPEIHHGPARIQFQGVLESGPPLGQAVETFPEMTTTTTLMPGQMILISMWPDAEQSLGWHFFSRHGGEAVEQRLVVVRVSKLPATDDLFAER